MSRPDNLFSRKNSLVTSLSLSSPEFCGPVVVKLFAAALELLEEAFAVLELLEDPFLTAGNSSGGCTNAAERFLWLAT